MRIIYGVDLSYRYGVYEHPEKDNKFIVYDHKRKKIVDEHDSPEAAINHTNWKNESEAKSLFRGMGKAAAGSALGTLLAHSVGYGFRKGTMGIEKAWKSHKAAKAAK